MSSNPSPYAPTNQSHALPPFPQLEEGRPVGVTVFAILSLVFGGLGLLSLLLSAGMYATGVTLGQPNAALDLFQTNMVYKVFTIVAMVLGIFFSIVQVVAGIGLLKMSELARKWTLIYAVYSIIAAVIASLMNLLYLFPTMKEQMATQVANTPAGAMEFMELSMYAGMVGGMIFALALPTAILWYFNRATIKAKFAAANAVS
ncbi:hypothetical protein N9N28_05085 [Rubripirellula amarantea]|nr:hypothetical protein [Rubripirellula amarantea]